MSLAERNQNSEDMFAETRMSFGEHLEDLRLHLWRAIYGFVIAVLISFLFGWPVLEFICAPVEQGLVKFYDTRVQNVEKELREGDQRLTQLNEPRPITLGLRTADASRLGFKIPEDGADKEWQPVTFLIQPLDFAITLAKAQQIVGRRPGLSTLSPMEAFMAFIKVSFVCGLIIGSPWIFYQIWAFVAAGLYPTEKRLVNVYLPVSLVLFIVGALVCQFLVLPNALQALLWFNQWLNMEPDIRFNEWLGFAILLPVVFGLSFQLPMVMMFLERIGVFTTEVYIQKWRIGVFLIVVFAGIITPVDLISMASLALAMTGLYGLGILLCWMNPGRAEMETEMAESEEMVEV